MSNRGGQSRAPSSDRPSNLARNSFSSRRSKSRYGRRPRDDSQATVRGLGARFTPEVFVFDEGRALRYHGRIDDNHRHAEKVGSHDLKNALDAILAGKSPPVTETTPVGCSVKWK